MCAATLIMTLSCEWARAARKHTGESWFGQGWQKSAGSDEVGVGQWDTAHRTAAHRRRGCEAAALPRLAWHADVGDVHGAGPALCPGNPSWTSPSFHRRD